MMIFDEIRIYANFKKIRKYYFWIPRIKLPIEMCFLTKNMLKKNNCFRGGIEPPPSDPGLTL